MFNILLENLIKSANRIEPVTTEAKYRAGLRVAFLSPGQENSGGALSIETY